MWLFAPVRTSGCSGEKRIVIGDLDVAGVADVAVDG